ncbi:hypothetical protein [Candidatus Parabeggiatoa sp. HSG14]|uniref:hypothetical protein n=1 Tax=Candidatus Parabeggiatoa sp. HSG14 TaxID=3055593 RepID=UPI0025A8BC28|nr:hypothetical protein [Thiotrichales bacterium HSG14]
MKKAEYQNLEYKLIYLLADPSIKDDALSKFFYQLKSGGLENCFDKAKQLRHLLISSDDKLNRDFETSIPKSKEKSTDLSHLNLSDYEHKILTQVDNLLKKEAQMTAKDIIDSMSSELGIKVPSSKRKFYEKVLYLVKASDGSRLLNIAYKIHDKKMDTQIKNDWPLREK